MGKYVSFDANGYRQAIEQSIQQVMKKVEKEVYVAIVTQFSRINFRPEDKHFISQMRGSIRMASAKTTEKFMASFIAGGQPQPNQSFRVVYYEYGTGEYMEPPSWYSLQSDPYKNPARQDKYIWSRRPGEWVDAGGNTQISNTRGGPRRLRTDKGYGKPIKPQRWFQNGVRQGTRNLDRYILEAVKSVPISAYISIADIHKRL